MVLVVQNLASVADLRQSYANYPNWRGWGDKGVVEELEVGTCNNDDLTRKASLHALHL